MHKIKDGQTNYWRKVMQSQVDNKKQTDGQTDRRATDRQTDRQIDRPTKK